MRRVRIKREFKVDCVCDLFSFPAEGIQESDDREIRIQLLDDAIGDAGSLWLAQGERKFVHFHSI